MNKGEEVEDLSRVRIRESRQACEILPDNGSGNSDQGSDETSLPGILTRNNEFPEGSGDKSDCNGDQPIHVLMLAKAIALGADAIAIGHSAMMALNCNKDIPEANYSEEIGAEPGYCYHCHTGRCPVGVATQDPELRTRLDPDEAAERVYNFLHTLTIEAQLFARACGKTHLHSLEPEDLAALTMEASAMAGVPGKSMLYSP